MALTVTKLLSDVHDCSTTSGWTADGGWGSLATDSAIYREGGTALRGQTSEGAGHCYYGISSVDLTAAANRRVYAWLLPPGSVGTKAAGGLRIVISDGTNRIAYYVGGNDDMGFQVGAWTCVMLDANDKPTNFATLAGSEASLSWTAVTEIGIGIYNPAKATGNSPNSWFDIVRYGTGLRITSAGGDDITFADIAADDASTATGKAYGILRELQAGVYGLQGDLIFGDGGGTGDIDFKDQDAVVVVEDHVHGTGTPTDFNLKGEHNATGTFSVELGVAVGSGDSQRGRNGVLFLNANTTQSVNFDFTDTDIETFLMYGGQLSQINGTVSFSADATNGPNHRLSGVTFGGCGQVDIGRVVTRNCTFSGYTADPDAALLWNANINLKNCSFIGNTDGTNDPHAIEHPTAGSFSYDGLTFSGNDYDINNSSSATEVDSYPDTNGDTAVQLYSGATERIAQSFVGTAGKLSRAIFSLQKVAAPTGNVVAKLYADTGGSGPGTLLATSEVVDIAGIGTSWAQVEFEFEDEYTLAAATTYWISVEYSDGDSSNRLEVEVDSSAPGHSGSCYTYNGSWGSQTYDMCFYVNRGGIVIVNATNGADPGTVEETASVKGATIINNTKTLFVSTKNTSGLAIPDVNVRIETDPGKVLISEGQTDAGGEYTDATYNYLGDEDVKVVARKKGLQNNFAFATIESTGLSVPFTMLRDKSANMP